MTKQPAAYPSPLGPDEVLLRIVATSDLHAHLLPFHYGRDEPCESVGLARIAGLIDRLRAEVPGSVLLDNGDFLVGSALGDHIAETGHWQGAVHPVIGAMNHLRYDAATPGNHELNHGLGFLRRALAGAAFPVVSANLCPAAAAEGDTLLPPFALVERRLADGAGRLRTVRLGVIGFLPPQTATWDGERLAGQAATPDILAAARFHLPRLRAAGADAVVALAHTGIGPREAEPGTENAATALALLDGIDAVVAGHAHLTFPAPEFAARPGVDPRAGRLCGRPAVMPGAFGSHVGVIDLVLRAGALPAEAAGPDAAPQPWQVARSRAVLHQVPDRPASGARRRRAGTGSDDRSGIAALAAADHAAARAALGRRVGTTDTPLATHFAMVADTAAMQLVARAQAAHVRAALAGTAAGRLPLLSAVAPFRSGGRGGPDNFTAIAAGPLLMRHLHDLYAFPNDVRAVELTGAELAEWLERAAAVFRRIPARAVDEPLIDEGFPSYNFDMVAGVTYRIDVSGPARYDRGGRLIDPAARRIRRLSHAGTPVGADDRFLLATNSYRLATWGLDPQLHTRPVPLRLTRPVRAAIADYLGSGARPGPVLPGEGWRLCLPPEATVILETSPDAEPADLAGSGLAGEAAGHSPRGFLRLRLRAAKG